MKTQSYKKKGFTLVELSIVLVIIGLLIGGILAAQSMINTSRIQSLIREEQQYEVAIRNFETEFDGLPGDSIKAGQGLGTVVGNGDGQINGDGTSNDELYISWQQLSLSVQLSNRYSGTATSRLAVPKVNVPQSTSFKNGMWFLEGDVSNNYYTGSEHTGRTQLRVGGLQAGGDPHPWFGPLTTADALAVDTKIDDGKPVLAMLEQFLRKVSLRLAQQEMTQQVLHMILQIATVYALCHSGCQLINYALRIF